MEGRDLRRSVNLSEQLVSVDSSSHHLRDLLKLREEDDLRLSRRRGEGVTLASVIASEKRDSAGRGRTLLDIIREEQEMHGGGGGVMVDGSSAAGINWRSFRERLRLRRAGIAWADDDAAAEPPPAVLPSPISDPELHVPDPTAPSAASTGAQAAAAAEADEGEQQQQTRVSLMSLLEQTDRQWVGSPSMGRTMGDEEEAAEERGEVVVNMCCVCMVRHKGAAFIPCGHTFCRRCSRELWVSRGNCPLCNGHIHEILDIF